MLQKIGRAMEFEYAEYLFYRHMMMHSSFSQSSICNLRPGSVFSRISMKDLTRDFLGISLYSG